MIKSELVQRISRQLLLAFMVEVLPSPSNRVTVDAGFKDELGNMRPVISYTVPEYTLRGVAYARQLARRIYQRLGYVEVEGLDIYVDL